ncbi:MAG: NAD(P)/FAD-dependent oxidoreductase [Sterolibacteriaceae bacterium]|nr:NAD(P)/FAD-dependent oxidoreductase [Candidatus Methylophosphatis haderslevensis]
MIRAFGARVEAVDFDVIVIGAGAAGMMCAARAGQRGRRVLLVDHAQRHAEKIRISGGGRCNFTNLDCRPEAFLSKNPHFCRSALARYTPRDFIELVQRHRIAYHEKTLGQLFCDDSALQIIAMLKLECERGQVRWAMPASVERVAPCDGEDGARFAVATSQGSFRCASLVIASGGLSIPKIGASPFGYRLAEQFGLAVVAPKPALVPLAADPEFLARFGGLSGASFDAVTAVAAPDKNARKSPRFRESVLLTHRGLSGPAILQISSYWQQAGGRGAIEIDLLPDLNAQQWLDSHRLEAAWIGDLLAGRLPRRVALAFAAAHGWDRPLAQLSNKVVGEIAATLGHWRIQPSGTLGFDKAEVTLGGVDTDGLSQQTMEAKSAPGLYFIGEVVDVTGWLGGYNFQWAWSSAVAAAEAL